MQRAYRILKIFKGGSSSLLIMKAIEEKKSAQETVSTSAFNCEIVYDTERMNGWLPNTLIFEVLK